MDLVNFMLDVCCCCCCCCCCFFFFFFRVVWAMPKLVNSTAFEGNLAEFDSRV